MILDVFGIRIRNFGRQSIDGALRKALEGAGIGSNRVGNELVKTVMSAILNTRMMTG